MSDSGISHDLVNWPNPNQVPRIRQRVGNGYLKLKYLSLSCVFLTFLHIFICCWYVVFLSMLLVVAVLWWMRSEFVFPRSVSLIGHTAVKESQDPLLLAGPTVVHEHKVRVMNPCKSH